MGIVLSNGEGINKIIWKCVEYKKCGCKGGVHTSEVQVIFHSENHACTPIPTKIVIKEVLGEQKKVAFECSDNNWSTAVHKSNEKGSSVPEKEK